MKHKRALTFMDIYNFLREVKIFSLTFHSEHFSKKKLGINIRGLLKPSENAYGTSIDEESTQILLNEEAVDELYEGLKSIYDCMTHFNTRTSGRWKGLFPMNSKQISSKP